MLGAEVHFLLCHYHADAPTRLQVDRFQSILVGSDVLVPVCSPDAEADWSGRFPADRKDRCGCSPTAKPPSLAGSWRHIQSAGT